MKTVNISLQRSDEVKQFVNIVSKYDYKIRLVSDDYRVNAKSILGVFSLDNFDRVTVEIYSTSCDDLIKELKPFIV